MLAMLLTVWVSLSAASGIHGIREFTANGHFTVPTGIETVLVEMWGGGGGGYLSSPGGGGGSGAYSRSVVVVKAGKT